MQKFRSLHYIPMWKDGHLLDNGIDLHTRAVNILLNPAHMTEPFMQRLAIINMLKNSHTEAWWPDEDGEFGGRRSKQMKEWVRTIDEPFYGETFTSTMGQTGGKNRTGDGIRIQLASETLKHPGRWFYFEYEVSEEALEFAKTWARIMADNNKGYDKKDIWTFFKLNENKRTQNLLDGMLICSGALWAYMRKATDLRQEKSSAELWRIGTRHGITQLPSPLLLALWQYMAGSQAFSLKTGKPLILGNK